eukprot:3815671-Amphidinium_carterae.2
MKHKKACAWSTKYLSPGDVRHAGGNAPCRFSTPHRVDCPDPSLNLGACTSQANLSSSKDVPG